MKQAETLLSNEKLIINDSDFLAELVIRLLKMALTDKQKYTAELINKNKLERKRAI